MKRSPEELDHLFAARFKAELSGNDEQADHKKADALLCELLTEMGFVNTVEAFNAVCKWYS